MITIKDICQHELLKIDDRDLLAGLAGRQLPYANFYTLNLNLVNFTEANLHSAYFIHARLREANFYKANCAHADFLKADLTGANFTQCDLDGANFYKARLEGIKLNWNARALIAEILRQNSSTMEQHTLTAQVAHFTNWCWDDFLKHNLPGTEWALRTLAKFIKPEDGHPSCLDKYAEKPKRFVPKCSFDKINWYENVIKKVIIAKDEEQAIEMANDLAKEMGILGYIRVVELEE